jgi:hypothetical protein
MPSWGHVMPFIKECHMKKQTRRSPSLLTENDFRKLQRPACLRRYGDDYIKNLWHQMRGRPHAGR